MRDIIFAHEKSLYEDELYSFAAYFFSQMNNLVGLHKILMCENIGKRPAYEYFHKTSLLHYPIILDALYTQRVLGN